MNAKDNNPRDLVYQASRQLHLLYLATDVVDAPRAYTAEEVNVIQCGLAQALKMLNHAMTMMGERMVQYDVDRRPPRRSITTVN